MSSLSLPPRPSLEHLGKQAKTLLKDFKSGDPKASERLANASAGSPAGSGEAPTKPEAKVTLRHAQRVIAGEYGFDTWAKLKVHVSEMDSADMVEMGIDSIRSSIVNYQRVVFLRAMESDRYLPIWIGPAEADSIALKLQNIDVPRPLTHDLLDLTIGDLGARVESVAVTDIRKTTFYASIVLRLNGKTVERDSRPSDAFGLAVRTGAPIFASSAVLEKAGFELEAGQTIESTTIERVRELGTTEGLLSRAAQDAITLAKEEATGLNHNAVGSEHLLLGVVRATDGVAAKALVNLGVELDQVAAAVKLVLGTGEGKVEGEPTVTPRAMRVLELAVDEARRLDDHHIGTEHIVMALLGEDEGAAAAVLKTLKVTMRKFEPEVLRLLEAQPG